MILLAEVGALLIRLPFAPRFNRLAVSCDCAGIPLLCMSDFPASAIFIPKTVPDGIFCSGCGRMLPVVTVFHEYDIPTLEPLNLFTEKSGPEIVSPALQFYR